MNKELETYIRDLRSWEKEDNLSDEVLAALDSCYVSLQNLVVANGLEDEYGDRKIYEGALGRLYDLCRRRTATTQSRISSGGEPSGSQSLSRRETEQGSFPGSGMDLLRLSRLLPLQYDLLHGAMRVSELGKVSETRKALRRFVEAWMQIKAEAPGPRPESAAGSEGMARGTDRSDQTEIEYGVLRCIADLLCYDTDEDRDADPLYAFFRNQIDAWTETLDAEGCWEDLPVDDALQRLQILTLNANLFQDPRHDALTGKAVRYYTRQMPDHLPSTGIASGRSSNKSGPESSSVNATEAANLDASSGIPAEQLYRLYDLNVWGTGRPDAAVIGRMSDFARREYARMHAPASAAARSIAASAPPASMAADTPCRPEDDATRLWLLAILIDRACRQTSSALQEEYFAHSA